MTIHHTILQSESQELIASEDRAHTFRLSELILVAGLGMGQLILADFCGMRMPFVVAACLAWTAFVAIGVKNLSTRRRWGIRLDTFPVVAKLLSIPLLVWILISLVIAWRQNVQVPLTHFMLVMILYPVWGTVQQHAVAVMLAGNLDAMTRGRWSRSVIVILTAAVFALVHLPEPDLVLPAFVMGLITIGAFLRWRNLWAIGLFHGFFAAFLYYLVLARDPLQEMLVFITRWSSF